MTIELGRALIGVGILTWLLIDAKPTLKDLAKGIYALSIISIVTLLLCAMIAGILYCLANIDLAIPVKIVGGGK